MGAARASEAEGDEVEMPELIDPQTLQRMLKDSDYATMETTIEALLLRAQAEARLRERKRIKEITAQVREEAQRKLKYRVGMAMKQIREEVNERVTSEVKAHASQQVILFLHPDTHFSHMSHTPSPHISGFNSFLTSAPPSTRRGARLSCECSTQTAAREASRRCSLRTSSHATVRCSRSGTAKARE
jgi:hypothetical protein